LRYQLIFDILVSKQNREQNLDPSLCVFSKVHNVIEIVIVQQKRPKFQVKTEGIGRCSNNKSVILPNFL
jgi:hypothetical protein